MKKVIVFDCDGVINTPWGFAESLEKDYGISPSDTEYFLMTGKTIPVQL